MQNKIISISSNFTLETSHYTLEYQRPIGRIPASVYIKPKDGKNGKYLLFDIIDVYPQDGRYIMEFHSGIPASNEVRIPFSAMIYTRPIEQNNIHGLAGMYIDSKYRGDRLSEALLELFVKLKSIDRTHPKFDLPFVHHTLMKDLGFLPPVDKTPTVIYFPDHKLYCVAEGFEVHFKAAENFMEAGFNRINWETYIENPRLLGKAIPIYLGSQLFRR